MEELLLSGALVQKYLSREEYQKYGREVVYRRGEAIYLPTDRLDTLFVLDQGAVKLGSYSSKGTEVTYDVVGPGEFFGNLQYLANNTFSEFAKALSSLRLFAYPTFLFKEIIGRDMQLAERFHEVMVRRWCRAETRLFANASLSPEERVSQLLQQYHQTIATKEDKVFTIENLLTQKDIADLTGLTRQTVAHIIKKIRKNTSPHRVKAA